jgi:hypothetical protein
MNQVLFNDGGVAALELMGVCSPSASNYRKGGVSQLLSCGTKQGEYHENVAVTFHEHIYRFSHHHVPVLVETGRSS